jgi:hypothetical protein
MKTGIASACKAAAPPAFATGPKSNGKRIRHARFLPRTSAHANPRNSTAREVEQSRQLHTTFLPRQRQARPPDDLFSAKGGSRRIQRSPYLQEKMPPPGVEPGFTA